MISPEILKIRAALFCIFTYLDTKTLLRAAEVCRNWKFVARHPAVWTRVLLENARISSKVLSEHEDIVIYVTVKITMCLLLLFKVYFLMYMYFFFLSFLAQCLSGALRRTL